MSKIIIALLLISAPLLKAEFVEVENPHKDYNGGNNADVAVPVFQGGNVNIDKCIQSVENLKPVFNKLLADSQYMASHEKIIRDLKVLSAQLQEVSGTCGISFGNFQGSGIPAECESDIKAVSSIVQSLNSADDNYFVVISQLMSLGQIIPKAIRDCQ
jgi:hypothetical protein